METSQLKDGYYIYGNKGNVWSDTAHIYGDNGNLCGTPALSSNWAQMEDVKHIGCKVCLEKYRLTEES